LFHSNPQGALPAVCKVRVSAGSAEAGCADFVKRFVSDDCAHELWAAPDRFAIGKQNPLLIDDWRDRGALADWRCGCQAVMTILMLLSRRTRRATRGRLYASRAVWGENLWIDEEVWERSTQITYCIDV
jgi:hypothetical protein